MVDRIDRCAGRVYNVGGGPANTISVWAEFGPMLQRMLDRPIRVAYADWRPGDQPIYVSDTRSAEADLGWHPKVSVDAGLERMVTWVLANQPLFSGFARPAETLAAG
jgi:CDP-paratose 2-epimerase